jgi:rhamnosyltransferase
VVEFHRDAETRPASRGDVSDVCAVVISYRPDLQVMSRAMNSMIGQVGRLLIFDNATPDPAVADYLQEIASAWIAVTRSPVNLGLGAAMNLAVGYAKAEGFNYLLVLDQDSIPEPGMVATLKTALLELQQVEAVAAVGPQFRDSRNGDVAPFVRVAFPFSHKLYGGPAERINCDFLISSGTLLPLRVMDEIGGMDEGLFIDNVDLEWSFRARHHGFALYGICDAQMRHSIGDSLRPSWFTRRGTTVHRPLRLYYIMRNRVNLYGRKETPARWIAQDIPRLVFKFFYTSIFLAPRRKYLQCMLRGLYDGVRGISGAAKL